MGMAAIPAGGILLRNPEMLCHLETETPYLTTSKQYTFVGTRSGASQHPRGQSLTRLELKATGKW